MKLQPDSQKLLFLIVRLQQLRQQKQERGYILVAILLTTILLLGLLTAYILGTRVETISSSASADSTSGFYSAEGALNVRAEQLLRRFADAGLPIGTSPTNLNACLDINPLNDGSGDFGCRVFQFNPSLFPGSGRSATTYVVDATAFSFVGGIPQAPTITVPPGDLYAGLSAQEYTYQLYSVAQRQVNRQETEAVLEMTVRARLLPLFQFAVFYQNDLESNSSSLMTLNGRVHTNASYFLVGGYNQEADPDQITQINGAITVGCPNTANPACPTSGTFLNGGFFNTLKDDPNYNNTDGKAQVRNASNTAWINIKGQGGNPAANPFRIDPGLINTNTGGRARIGSAFGVQPLTVPPTSTLDRVGDYFANADIRVEYRPGSPVPFEIRRVDSTSLARPRAVAEAFTLASNKGEGVLRSLMQPVLADVALSAVTNQYQICPSLAPAAPAAPVLTAAQQAALIRILQVAVASQATPIRFADLQSATSGTLLTRFNTLVAANPTLAPQATALAALTPVQIAAYGGRCFVPAPIQEVQNWRNDREARLISMIQFNIGSLAVWNRDGIYVEMSGGGVTSDNAGNGFSTDSLLYARAAADASAPSGTLQNLGYVAADITNGGIVLHATIDTAAFPYPAQQSPYAFALTGGRQLFGLAQTANFPEPTGLTVASDQAIYLQGNYNSTRALPADFLNPGPEPSGVKQPAAIMADTLNVLSNLCINPGNYQIEKAQGTFNGTDRLNCTINGAKVPINANIAGAFTAINSAFLANTDETNATNGNNGGLNNYPRTHEDWNLAVPLFIRGSFVSLGYPVHVNGRLQGNPGLGIGQNDIFTPPIRLWDYDPALNLASNLPPLTPTARWLSQEAFVRRYNR